MNNFPRCTWYPFNQPTFAISISFRVECGCQFLIIPFWNHQIFFLLILHLQEKLFILCIHLNNIIRLYSKFIYFTLISLKKNILVPKRLEHLEQNFIFNIIWIINFNFIDTFLLLLTENMSLSHTNIFHSSYSH